MTNYAFDNDLHEIARLALQSKFFHELTEQFLRRSGLASGMRVLELGCGVGGVTRIIADIVGEDGSISVVDANQQRLEYTKQSLSQLQPQLSFVRHDLQSGLPSGEFDAIVGRMILMYLKSPQDLLAEAYSRLSPGGLVVLQEPDHEDYLLSRPHSEVFAKWKARLAYTVGRIDGISENFGKVLPTLVERAGFSIALNEAEYRVDGGTCSDVYEVLGGVLLGMAEKMEQVGIIRSRAEVPHNIAEILRDEAVGNRLAIYSSRLVGVSARKV